MFESVRLWGSKSATNISEYELAVVRVPQARSPSGDVRAIEAGRVDLRPCDPCLTVEARSFDEGEAALLGIDREHV